MWHYPKSAVHQAAIDAQKPERDREADKSRAAVKKLRREEDANKARADVETNRLAVLAKTKRLRSERLAREACTQAEQSPRSLGKDKARSP